MSENAPLAVATGALVVGVYASALPNMAEARAQADDRGHLAAAQSYAAIVSVALVLGVAAATRSAEAAAVGLVATIGLAVAYRGAVDSRP